MKSITYPQTLEKALEKFGAVKPASPSQRRSLLELPNQFFKIGIFQNISEGPYSFHGHILPKSTENEKINSFTHFYNENSETVEKFILEQIRELSIPAENIEPGVIELYNGRCLGIGGVQTRYFTNKYNFEETHDFLKLIGEEIDLCSRVLAISYATMFYAYSNNSIPDEKLVKEVQLPMREDSELVKRYINTTKTTESRKRVIETILSMKNIATLDRDIYLTRSEIESHNAKKH